MTLPSDFGECVERLRRSTVLIGDGGKSGSGSGVILDAGGTIGTNAHVVHSPRLTVQLHDGTTHRAMVRAHDSKRDLALLSIGRRGLPAAVKGNSRQLRPGALVVAVGNPFGFLGAVTVGAVRGTGTVRGLGSEEWIQSDLRLAPGNSGGPLANAAGEVVGLNAMIAGRLALAVPIEALKRLVAEGESRATLGVALKTVSVIVRGEARTGLCILDIAGGSPAEAASLMPGDIVIGVNDAPVGSPDDILEALQGHTERVMRIQFLRGDRSTVRTASVLLGSSRSRAA
jgi:serine protease Do